MVEVSNLIVRLHKDGERYRKVDDQLKASRHTAAGGIRRYRTSHGTANQSHSDRPASMTHSAEKQMDKWLRLGTGVINSTGLSVEIRGSVTDSVKDIALHQPHLAGEKVGTVTVNLRVTSATFGSCVAVTVHMNPKP